MFYYLFSKGYDSYNVWLLDWINEIYPFYKFDMSKIAEWTYWMYDTSRDGELSLADLMHAKACCPAGCQLWEEIEYLIDSYTNQVVCPRQKASWLGKVTFMTISMF